MDYPLYWKHVFSWQIRLHTLFVVCLACTFRYLCASRCVSQSLAFPAMRELCPSPNYSGALKSKKQEARIAQVMNTGHHTDVEVRELAYWA